MPGFSASKLREKQELCRLLSSQAATKSSKRNLLERSVGRLMRGDVAVIDLPRSHFQNHEKIKNSERRRRGDEEVAGDDGLRVIAHEGHPALGREPATGPRSSGM